MKCSLLTLDFLHTLGPARRSKTLNEFNSETSENSNQFMINMFDDILWCGWIDFKHYIELIYVPLPLFLDDFSLELSIRRPSSWLKLHIVNFSV